MTRSADALLRTYFIPRGGVLVRETAGDIEDLRRIRTELELLRRIRRRAASLGGRCRTGAPIGAGDKPRRFAATAFSPGQRHELRQIIRDAAHSVVEEMTEVLDREFPDIRKEIMMSVVNEEAENIVHDAAEAGIIEAGESGATGVESDSADFPPVDVEAALAEAEAELAKAAGTVNLGAGRDAASVEPPTMEPPPTATLPTDVGLDAPSSATPARDPDPAGAPDTAAWDDQAGGTADTGGPVVDTSMAPVELGDAHSTPDDGVEGARETATFDVDTVDIDTVCRPAVDMIALAGASSSQGRVQHPSVDPSLTPAQAEKAVADIERGIRSLAALLETQITEQWRLAREGFAEADAARAKTHEASRSAQAMLQEIARLREEARIARDDADVARRETKLMREDAQRAKERAEASAAGAELAAEQTQREAELAVGRVETAAS